MTSRHRLAPLSCLLMLTMLFAGCVAPSPPDWGGGSGEVQATISSDSRSVTIDNRISPSQDEWTQGLTLDLIGCNDGTAPENQNGINASTIGGGEIEISGWLSHDKAFGEGRGRSSIAHHGVIIHLEDWESVSEWGVEEVTHVAVNEWNEPGLAEARPLGEADDKFPDRGWAVVGLIAASESVNEGFAGLNEWNRPIRMSGYLVSANASVGQYGNPDVSNCRLSDGVGEGYSGLFVVTWFEVGGRGVVDADDGYPMGDVPFIGRFLYLAVLVLGGAGGAFGLFIYSTASIRAQAAADAKMMLTEEQIREAREVASQVKEHKRRTEGMARANDDEEEFGKPAEKNLEPVKKPDFGEEPAAGIKAFDLDGVLDTDSDASDLMMHRRMERKHGAAVVETDAAADMDDQLAEMALDDDDGYDDGYDDPAPAPRHFERRGSPVVSSGRDGDYDEPPRSRAPIRDDRGPSSGGRGGGRDRGGRDRGGGGRGSGDGAPRREPRKRSVRRGPPAEERQEEPAPRRRRPKRETRKGPSVTDDDFSDFNL